MAQRTGTNAWLIVAPILAVCLLGLDGWLGLQCRDMKREMASVEAEKDSWNGQNDALREEISEASLLADENLVQKAAEEKKACDDLICSLEKKIQSGESDKKIAYLTFDDGPYNLTDTFLDILRDKHVRATFFLRYRPTHIDTIKREIAEGHTIGNHSFSHNMKNIYQSVDSCVADIERQQKWLTDTFGVTPAVYRFPGGSSTAKDKKDAIAKRLAADGLGYVDWNAATGDGLTGVLTRDKAYAGLISSVKNQPIVVVLMHDYNQATCDALPDIIDTLRSKGYLLLPLTPGSVMVKGR